MGQTLTHGVYLPDEGERNCYSGLAANWQILDTSVGTIAEHTSALSGKAPLVHTHSKADITDLFNSANTWSSQQTYSYYSTSYKNIGYEIGIAPSSNQVQLIDFTDKNNNRIGWFRRGNITNGSSRLDVEIFNRFSNGSLSPTGTELGAGFSIEFNSAGDASVRPDRSNAIDLGTSSNKWKTLNGINPGALSLPNVNAVTGSSNTQLQNISGNLVQDQYFNCYFTPRMDGWVYIALDCSGASIISGCSSYTVSVKTSRLFADALYTQSFTKNENSCAELQILFPVTANKEITLEFTFTRFSVIKAYVIPAQGNV